MSFSNIVFVAVIAATLLSGCKKTDKTPMPKTLDSSVTTESAANPNSDAKLPSGGERK